MIEYHFLSTAIIAPAVTSNIDLIFFRTMFWYLCWHWCFWSGLPWWWRVWFQQSINNDQISFPIHCYFCSGMDSWMLKWSRQVWKSRSEILEPPWTTFVSSRIDNDKCTWTRSQSRIRFWIWTWIWIWTRSQSRIWNQEWQVLVDWSLQTICISFSKQPGEFEFKT